MKMNKDGNMYRNFEILQENKGYFVHFLEMVDRFFYLKVKFKLKEDKKGHKLKRYEKKI